MKRDFSSIERAVLLTQARLQKIHPDFDFEAEAKYSAPVFYLFALWTLRRAAEDGVKRLYYLARDCYLPWLFAKRLSEELGLGIECRYLRCSRRALRVPSFCLLEREETLQLIGIPALGLTADRILGRVLSGEDAEAVAAALQLGREERNRILSHRERFAFLGRLRGCETFWERITRISAEEYGPCRAYFEGEGLCDGTPFAVIDTGWTGSIQRSLRQLLESMGMRRKLLGYYFGLYRSSEDPGDGVLKTFCFDLRRESKGMAAFSNNLLECMAVLPDPMTRRYRLGEKGAEPEYEPGTVERIEERIEIFETFASCATECGLPALSDAEAVGWCLRTMIGLSYRPGRKAASLFADRVFSDDPSESGRRKLAEPLTVREACKLLLPVRLLRKCLGKGSAPLTYWDYGSIGLSRVPFRPFFRWNVLLWEKMRLRRIVKTFRRNRSGQS